MTMNDDAGTVAFVGHLLLSRGRLLRCIGVRSAPHAKPLVPRASASYQLHPPLGYTEILGEQPGDSSVGHPPHPCKNSYTRLGSGPLRGLLGAWEANLSTKLPKIVSPAAQLPGSPCRCAPPR
jgi:hypothetical protein